MASILNNVGALGASRQLEITGSGLNKTIERLTTGKRINRASDDAAGLAISNKLGADIRIAGQGKRNANDGISYLQVADGVLEEVTSLLTRATELTEQARTGTISDSNRTSLDAEFQNILKALADIGESTTFNGTPVYTTSTLTVAVGGYSDVSITVGTISNGSNEAFDMVVGTDSITSVANATAVKDKLTQAIDNVSNIRASIGATQQQLTSVSNSLGIQVENFTAAYSQIRDANIADEVVNLTKFQILNQSGTSALKQANQASQSILSLLQ
nr:flagellin [uncultured Holophaga sp.]